MKPIPGLRLEALVHAHLTGGNEAEDHVQRFISRTINHLRMTRSVIEEMERALPIRRAELADLESKLEKIRGGDWSAIPEPGKEE